MEVRRRALGVAFGYALAAIAWIAISDTAISLVTDDLQALAFLQTVKGAAFVLVTSVLLYWLVARSLGSLKRSEQAYREAKEWFRELVNTIPHGIKENDLEGRITFTNPAYPQMLGYAPGELEGRFFWELVPAGERERLKALFRRVVRGQPVPTPYYSRSLTRDGEVRDLRVDWTYRRDGTGRVVAFLSVVTDITEQLRAEERLRQAAAVFDSTSEAILVTSPEGSIVRVNPAFERMTGYAEDEVVGQRASLLRSDVHDRAFFRAMWASLQEAGHWQGEIWNRRKGGQVFPMWMSISAVVSGGESPLGFVAVGTDLSAAKESEQRLEHLTHFDPLTELPNRLLFEARLSHALERADGRRVAVLTMDLDRFKNVNDSLGHPIGDEVLKETAQRLRQAIPGENTVARPGGDEFSVILEEVSDLAQVVGAAQRMLDVMSRPFRAGGQEVYVSASVGIALYPDDATDLAVLVKNAEAAMYRAKDFGRNNHQFYTEELTDTAYQRLSLETELRYALERGEFELHYQPQVTVATGRVTGLEALLRWRKPGEAGLRMPGEFIPLAEESGLIQGIGMWVLEEVCSQIVRWQRAGIPLTRVAVNVSGEQITRPGLVQEMGQLLQATGVPAHLLELEITETAIMRQAEAATANMAALRAMGICLAVDDFGTGYSSMNYLKRFAVDRLKVDRSFVRDLEHDASDRAIAQAIVALARSLELTAIAEGVETEGQRRWLQEFGCEEYQGYLFSRPLPAEEIAPLLARREA